MLEGPLVSAAEQKPEDPFPTPSSSIPDLHRNVPLSSATSLCSSPTTALPRHGLTLCGIGTGRTQASCLAPVWGLEPLLAPSFGAAGSPGTRQPSFSLWTQSVQSQAPREAHSVIPFNVFYMF